jgi:hypothetical protein
MTIDYKAFEERFSIQTFPGEKPQSLKSEPEL